MLGSRIFSWIVLLLLVMQTVIVFVFWQVRIHALHSAHWNNQQNETTIKLSLSLQEFEKARVNNHELKIDGILFDIKQIEKTAEGYSMVLYPDKDEQSILQEIASFFSMNTQTPANGSRQIIPIIFALNFFQDRNPLLFCNSEKEINHSFSYRFFCNQPWLPQRTPPPKA